MMVVVLVMVGVVVVVAAGVVVVIAAHLAATKAPKIVRITNQKAKFRKASLKGCYDIIRTSLRE